MANLGIDRRQRIFARAHVARSVAERRQGHCEHRATAAAVVGQVALMPAHDCLLHEDVPGPFAEPGLDSPGREDQAQAGDQSSAQ